MSSVRVSVRLPEHVVAYLDREAQSNELTRSAVIKRVLGLYARGQHAPELRGGEDEWGDLSHRLSEARARLESREAQVG